QLLARKTGLKGPALSMQRIEDYAIIGNTRTAALVGRNGSIDWLSLPRFDSGACFASLVGTEENGRWLIAPAGEVRAVARRYRGGAVSRETHFTNATGAAVVTDFMRISTEPASRWAPTEIFRLVGGERGTVRMRLDLVLRFDYGQIVPWVRRRPDGIYAIAG